jgi:cytochrome c556
MRKLILAISMLAFAGSAAFADQILDRQAMMKERGKIVGGLSKMVKGEQAFDAAEVLTALQALEVNAEKFDADVLFPVGSDSGDTTASPKIWEDMAGFKATEDKYLANVKAAAAAAPGDVDALKTQLGTLGGDCGTCHKAYRIKKG